MQALIFLVKSLADLYLLTFLMRFIMQWVRAGYNNPLAQFIFKITNLTAYCRLGNVKFQRGARDVFSLGHTDEVAQMPKLHREKPQS